MKIRQVLIISTLMIIGETIFFLPFIITRVFRPTFLTVFDITNLELGSAFSLYGVVAMASYFAGGPLADRFPPRKILPLAFLATSAGGILLLTIPSIWTLTLLYGFWGMTTILMFWAGYIKAQRDLGQQMGQGQVFGMVDAGRGLVIAIFASGSVFLLNFLLPVSADIANVTDFRYALQSIIILFTSFTVIGAILSRYFLPKETGEDVTKSISLKGIREVSRKKTVWLNAFIVICAYIGYKCTDVFSLYAVDSFGYNDVEAAHLATVSFWVRPIAAVLAGFLGDRFAHSRLVIVCFVIVIVGSMVFASGIMDGGMLFIIALTIAITSVGIYGLRGLYFALFHEANIPMVFTGSAAGFVSFLGYTPDIFMGPLIGVIIDNNPGEIGFQYLFGVLASFSVLGLILTVVFRKSVKG